MSYECLILPKLQKKLDKKRFRDKKDIIYDKMDDIAEILEKNPNHFKNLRKPLNKYKRAHVDTSFVLVFEVDVKNKTVIFYDYDHHKCIYNE